VICEFYYNLEKKTDKENGVGRMFFWVGILCRVSFVVVH